MKEALSASRWNELATRLRLREALRVFRALQAHYGERARKYHTARHINDSLAVLDRAHHPEAANPFVEYALWFHDAVYSTFSTRNEQRSADWAARVLAAAGAPPEAPDLVRSLILATRHGVLPSGAAHQLLVDVDLAILGADAERYREFELQIRAEYWWAPTALYRRQRIAILRSFILRPSIYATHEFRERHERQARNNIAWALDQLQVGTATFRWTARF